jgi:hypothetical protein
MLGPESDSHGRHRKLLAIICRSEWARMSKHLVLASATILILGTPASVGKGNYEKSIFARFTLMVFLHFHRYGFYANALDEFCQRQSNVEGLFMPISRNV